MRILFFVFCFTFLSACSDVSKKSAHRPNYIDSIKNEEQIKKLLFKIDPKKKYVYLPKKLKFEGFAHEQLYRDLYKFHPLTMCTKADLDKNGLTDLLVIDSPYSDSFYCIFDKGNQQFEFQSFFLHLPFSCAFPIVKKDKLTIYYEVTKEFLMFDSLRLKHLDLIYKFGSFIEENKHPSHHSIQEIKIHSGYIAKNIIGYSFSLNEDLNATGQINKEFKVGNISRKGNYTTKIKRKQWNEITALINYIGFEQLKEKYEVNGMDNFTLTMTIKYDHGKTKIIEDYGMIGTYGLRNVYRQLHQIYKNSNWKKVEKLEKHDLL